MNGRDERRTADATSGMVSPWRGTAPELLIAAAAVTAAALAGYAVAGWAGLTVVAVATAAGVLVLVRALLPQLTPEAAKKAPEKPRARTLTGYSHRRFIVRNAMSSQDDYDLELRPVLEHLLAARLAERHGVHLYQDPDAARRRAVPRPTRRRTVAVDRPGDPAGYLVAGCRGQPARHPAAHPGASR